ncbi:MAG: response regulator [Gemmataceae bacterium]
MAGDILIADRDEVLVGVYRSFLLAEGYRVESVCSGIACIQAIRRRPPRLLVLDPELLWGGMGVLALIAERDEIPFVPVLVLTRHPAKILAEVLPAGGSAVVLKPVKPVTLVGLVKSMEAATRHVPDHRVASR